MKEHRQRTSKSRSDANPKRRPEPSGDGKKTDTDKSAELSNSDQPLPFPVVGIVSSAGGLKPVQDFFTAMPPDSGAAFILVPHLDPSHKSLIVELISKRTAMTVVEAGEGMQIAPDRVYVIPPGKFLEVRGGKLRLSRPEREHPPNIPLDFFLRSLARDQRERAACVILSGTGSHGVVGLKAVKEQGGVVAVQSPDEAEFDPMPWGAVDTGQADFVLPAGEIPGALVGYFRTLASRKPGEEADDGEAVRRILSLLRARTRYDFRGYRSRMIRRRITRRMGLLGIVDLSKYLAYLRERSDEVDTLFKDLMIGVTSFFRDPETFRELCDEALPRLIGQKGEDEPIRVWVVGCATGEEAYTIAMLLSEEVSRRHRNNPVQLFATDIDAASLETARAGIYAEGVVADVPPPLLKRYFNRVDRHHYKVTEELRDQVVFASQNVISDPPFSRMDLISCRNLLIYLEPQIQKNVIDLFHFSLNGGGILLLGTSETVGSGGKLFETVSKKQRIFRRESVLRPPRPAAPAGRDVQARTDPAVPPPFEATERGGFSKAAQQLLLNEYAPASVLVDRTNSVLYFHGDASAYLEIPSGVPTQDLLAMTREGLRSSLRAVLRRGREEKRGGTVEEARVKRKGKYFPVRIRVKPVSEPRSMEGFLLVTFEETVPQRKRKGKEKEKETRHREEEGIPQETVLRQLETELKTTREDLQSTIEELESANEELKASNEEVTSMNEELQSANEELETSREELQSLNEELTTVNGQLQEKVGELERINNDMANLLTSTEIATLFLDTKFRISRFTPAMRRLMNLIASDVGRPLTDISRKFVDPSLISDAESVLEELSPLEKEIRTEGGEWYLRRILPYRTADKRVEGVVVTFNDITLLKDAQEIQKRAQHELEARFREQRKFAVLGELMSLLAHEIKSPLAALEGAFHSFGTFPEGDSRAELLEKMVDEVRHLDRLVWNFLQLARPWKTSLEEIELRSFAARQTDLAKLEGPFAKIRFVLEKGDPVTAPADPVLLEQVIWNLVHNAAEAMNGEGEIRIRAREGEDGPRLEIRDNGRGMSREVQEKLFQPFFTTRKRGTGLGLSICRKIMEAHGGTLDVESEPEQGTTVALSFPGRSMLPDPVKE